MEKNRLVGFMAKVMEESGFKVYRDFKTSRHIIDIYGVLGTVLGDIGVVVACKNYDERWDVGLDVLKEMEMVAKTLKASKVVVVTTSHFTDNAVDYASRRNIKLIDKEALINLAKSFSGRNMVVSETVRGEMGGKDEEEEEYVPKSQSTSISFFSHGSTPSLSGRRKEGFLSSLEPTTKFLLSNTIFLIIIVLLISQLLTYIIGSLNTTTNAVLGILKILFSALLSYGIVLAVDRDVTVTLVKGTTVFFVSLLIYVVLIIIL